MKNFLTLIAIAAFFTATSASGAEPASGSIKPATVPVAASDTKAKNGALSQQDKMRLCAKQASGKKGQERKSFMKTCLSKKPAA